ncbi:glycine-rich protein 5-like [Andrographis paniculata]|uniref:glycine-rich protein 5-like n=1 Tax=Andrographis paniculata TaxID=175694 RepID=UPI0021E8C3CE|nr:glycine-rich protein 5-like [Andrographis paniculata]
MAALSSSSSNCLFILAAVALILLHSAHAARPAPVQDKTLEDQKNFFTFGGMGSYAGVGPTGIPYGGVGGAIGNGGLVGGAPLTGLGGFVGTNPNGGFTGVGGAIPGGVVTVGGNTGGFNYQPHP